MRTKLLNYTKDAALTVAIAGRLCYSNKSVDELKDEFKDSISVAKFIKGLIASGHESPLEHASYTFSIEGISRVALAQITRHRLASFSVRSCRYNNMHDSVQVIPKSFRKAGIISANALTRAAGSTDLYDDLLLNEVPKEDARYILSEGTTTSMVVTMNARELRHFFNLRCCNRAQWEIRSIADEMLRLVKEVSLPLFEDAGASCVQYGYCPEGKRSCGKVPTLQDIMTNYKEKQR